MIRFGSQSDVRSAVDGAPKAAVSLARPVCCPVSCGLTRSQIEGIAETWAAKALERAPRDWVRQFVESLGGEVRSDPSARLLVAADPDGRFVVTADGAWPLAEALGHYVLHLPTCEPVEGAPAGMAVPMRIAAAGELNRARAEADWFAAAFLMPEGLVRAAWERHSGSLPLMARDFRVPSASLAARALRLGLR